MANASSTITALQLDKNIAQLRTKLARQVEAVKTTEAHIAALESLKTATK